MGVLLLLDSRVHLFEFVDLGDFQDLSEAFWVVNLLVFQSDERPEEPTSHINKHEHSPKNEGLTEQRVVTHVPNHHNGPVVSRYQIKADDEVVESWMIGQLVS